MRTWQRSSPYHESQAVGYRRMILTSGKARPFSLLRKARRKPTSFFHADGDHTARLMRPIYVEQSCLKCHKHQDYKIGDVRGGISVTVPVDSIWKAGSQQARNVFVVLACIWLLGAVTIVLVGKSKNQRRLEREKRLGGPGQETRISRTLSSIISVMESWPAMPMAY